MSVYGSQTRPVLILMSSTNFHVNKIVFQSNADHPLACIWLRAVLSVYESVYYRACQIGIQFGSQNLILCSCDLELESILILILTGNIDILTMYPLRLPKMEKVFGQGIHVYSEVRGRIRHIVRGLDRPTLHPHHHSTLFSFLIAIYMYIYCKDVNIENIGTHLAYHADLCKA